jgi:putative ABC transport system substrate-binding protein
MRLRTIGLISTLVLGLLAGPLPAEAQQTGKVYRIGYLRYSCGGSLTNNPRYIPFRKGLRELGYIEGQNFVIEYRCADRKPERRPEIAAEMVRLKVDVILAPGARGYIRALQRATRTIPIVLIAIRVDPVKAGYVVSLARPGGNITGITNLESDLHPKRLELLKEVFPRISRVAILWTAGQQRQGMKKLEAAGQALGIQIQSLDAPEGLGSFESAFSAMIREHPDGLIVATSASVIAHRARIFEFTAKRRLPTISSRPQFVDTGGLMSYGPDFQHLYRRVATYVDKILKGAKPGDLPIEQPTKFKLIINLKTANQIGVTIPQEMLFRADKVIK